MHFLLLSETKGSQSQAQYKYICICSGEPPQPPSVSSPPPTQNRQEPSSPRGTAAGWRTLWKTLSEGWGSRVVPVLCACLSVTLLLWSPWRGHEHKASLLSLSSPVVAGRALSHPHMQEEGQWLSAEEHLFSVELRHPL